MQIKLSRFILGKLVRSYSFLSKSVASNRYNVTRRHMEELCENIMSLGYQFILIDCPAGIDVGFINAISPAKEGLIITTPEITSIRDAGKLRCSHQIDRKGKLCKKQCIKVCFCSH